MVGIIQLIVDADPPPPCNLSKEWTLWTVWASRCSTDSVEALLEKKSLTENCLTYGGARTFQTTVSSFLDMFVIFPAFE